MKQVLLIMLLVASVIIFPACQKEITDPNGTTTTTGSVTGDFRAKVDGVQFIGDSIAGAARQNGIINITGVSRNGQIITITVADSGVHNYTFDINSSANAAAYFIPGSSSSFTTNGGINSSQVNGGTLSITSIDTSHKKISGTFSFKVYRSLDTTQKNITEGTFTNLTYSTSLPPAASTDTFRVKIDGADFAVSSINAVLALNTINIVSGDAQGVKTVGLTFPSNITPGTYNLDFLGFTYIGQYNANATTFLSSDLGTLTILEHNTTTKRIRGNFNFHAASLLGGTTPTAQLTAGYFRLSTSNFSPAIISFLIIVVSLTCAVNLCATLKPIYFLLIMNVAN